MTAVGNHQSQNLRPRIWVPGLWPGHRPGNGEGGTGAQQRGQPEEVHGRTRAGQTHPTARQRDENPAGKSHAHGGRTPDSALANSTQGRPEQVHRQEDENRKEEKRFDRLACLLGHVREHNACYHFD